MFKRTLSEELVFWKNRPNHLPLILRGARQVGKTSLIDWFGKHHYTSYVSINLEAYPMLSACFDTLEPLDILNRITAYTQQVITPGQTLFFIDEIQACPKAILSLRYFKEKLPDLDVIATGSLLEFVLNSPDFSMPVGRVEFLYLKPLSFQEFLLAREASPLLENISTSRVGSPLPLPLHQKALDYIREYWIIGGMPAVVAEYHQSRNLALGQRLQQHLLMTFRSDFGKYKDRVNIPILVRVFEKMPLLIGQPIKYSKIDPDLRSYLLKDAIELLSYAGLVYPIYATTATGIPLNALINQKKYKLLFLDIGLILVRSQLASEVLTEPHLMMVHRGALAEQFVGQELLAYQLPYLPADLYFWLREEKNSQAEVDYVIAHEHQVIPIEVKAGATGRLKSLNIFMKEKSSILGVRVSELPLSFQNNILTVPFYMLHRLMGLIEEMQS